MAISAHGLVLLGLLTQIPLPPASERPNAGTENHARVIERIPVSADGSSILVPVTLAGKVYQFLLDTGASTNVYDSTLKPFLGRRLYATDGDASTGTMKLEFFDSPKATLGKLSVHTLGGVGCTDLNTLREVSGNKVYGIIGMDFLKNHVVSLNFDEEVIEFFDSADALPGTRIPLYKVDEDLCAFYMNVSGIGLRKFAIDFGSSYYASFTGSDFDLLRQRGKITAVEDRETWGLAGGCRARVGRVEQVVLGDFRHSDVPIITNPSCVLHSVGIPFLRQYNTAFDFPNQLAYVSKSRSFGQPEPHDLSGLTLWREANQVVVDSVEDDSPAAVGGVRPSDVVLKIDGVDASQIHWRLLERQLASVGRKVQLTLQRKGQSYDVFIILHGPRKRAAP